MCVVTMTETGDVFAFCGTDLVIGLAAMLGQLTGFDVARVLDNERNNRADDTAREQLQAARDGDAESVEAVEAPQDAAGTDSGGEVTEAGSVELEAVDGDLAAAFAAGVAAAIEAGMSEGEAALFVAEAFEAGLNPFDVLEQLAGSGQAGEAGPDDDQDDDQDEDAAGIAAAVGEYLSEQLPPDDQDRAEAANYA